MDRLFRLRCGRCGPLPATGAPRTPADDRPTADTRQLAAAKKQFIGQIGISREARESYAIGLGKTYAHYDAWRDLDALAKEVDALTSEELQTVAAEVFAPDQLSLLVYTSNMAS